jgi:hypothetical protein
MKKRKPDSGIGGGRPRIWTLGCTRLFREEVSKIRRLRRFLLRPDFVKTDARPGTLSPSPRHETTLNASEGASLATPGNAHDHPPLIIKSRGFLIPLRKQLCVDPIHYNGYKSSYDISRSKASAASSYTGGGNANPAGNRLHEIPAKDSGKSNSARAVA